MSDQLTLSHTLNNTNVPVSNQPRLLYLLIETGGGQPGSVRVPVHLALVVDKSDSMLIRIAPTELQRLWLKRGWVRENVVDGLPTFQVDINKVSREELRKLPRAIDAVKQALRAAVEALGPNDRFALILFAGQAVQTVPLSPSSERKRILSALDTMEELALGDDTYMGRGMSLGLEELVRGANPSVTSRMIVLTDGFTLDEADCRVMAQRAKSKSVSISTMGMGGEFNEDLLIPIADDTGGHAYIINAPGDIPAAFQQELNAVQSIAYRNLELKLRLSQGVELRAAHRVRPALSHLGSVLLVDRSASLDLGDYEVNAPPALLLELLTPPRSMPGAYRLIQLILAYDDPAGGLARQTIRQDVVVNYLAGSVTESPNPRVMNVVERVTAFKLQTRALEDAQRGDIPGATRKLQAAATRLLEMGETELAAEMQQEATNLEQKGQMSAKGTKKISYATRKLTQKLDEIGHLPPASPLRPDDQTRPSTTASPTSAPPPPPPVQPQQYAPPAVPQPYPQPVVQQPYPPPVTSKPIEVPDRPTQGLQPVPAPVSLTRACSACGSLVRAQARFCPRCGQAVNPDVTPSATDETLQKLRLDAAVPERVHVGQAFELGVAIRQVMSPVLREKDLVQVESGDVQVSWPQSQPFVRLRVQISAPDCEIHGDDAVAFRLYAGQDSPVFYFHLTSKKAGEIGIIVKVYQEDDWLGSARVHTVAQEQVAGEVQVKLISYALKPDLVVGSGWSSTAIRDLLMTGFNDQELTTLCFDCFRPVYAQFAMGMSMGQKVQLLLDYCERHAEVDKLLHAVKERNPTQYARVESATRPGVAWP